MNYAKILTIYTNPKTKNMQFCLIRSDYFEFRAV